MKAIIKRRLLSPLQSFLMQGITPKKLALTVALGLIIAIFPLIGSTTLLCALTALIFRLNMPAIQLINYLAYPLQFAFFIPFIRMGEYIFDTSPLPLSINQIFTLFKTNFLGTFQTLWWSTMHAMIAWLVICPVIGLVVYFILVPIFKRVIKKSGVKNIDKS